MLLPWVAVIIGLALLVWSADRFIFGSAALARGFGISPLIVGMVIVGFGTSAPELVVSTLAAFQDSPGISMGNVIGSNLVNTGLILGAVALLKPFTVQRSVLRIEMPMVLAASVAVYLMALDGFLTYRDGLMLLLGFVGFLAWMLYSARRGEAPVVIDEAEIPRAVPTGRSVFWIIVGLVLLIASSQALVWGATRIAAQFGVSDLVIGLTVVAVGTSLPELAASVAGILKGENDIALGNILGSNLFNLLAILQAPAWIAPGAVPDGMVGRDLPAMIGVTLLLILFAWNFGRRQPRVNRVEGALLLFSYIGYTVYLIHTSTGG
jgi:cation:H+ antiporter